jgi:cytoskeletal protein RodZ
MYKNSFFIILGIFAGIIWLWFGVGMPATAKSNSFRENEDKNFVKVKNIAQPVEKNSKNNNRLVSTENNSEDRNLVSTPTPGSVSTTPASKSMGVIINLPTPTPDPITPTETPTVTPNSTPVSTPVSTEEPSPTPGPTPSITPTPRQVVLATAQQPSKISAPLEVIREGFTVLIHLGAGDTVYKEGMDPTKKRDFDLLAGFLAIIGISSVLIGREKK